MTPTVTVRLSLYVWSFLLWSFHKWYKVKISTCDIFLPSFFSMVQSSCYKFYVYFRNLCYTTLTQISHSNAAKSTCEKCGTQTRISHFWRHKRTCSTGTLRFTQCPNFSTTSQTYLSLLPQSFGMTVETWQHFLLTTLMCIWTTNLSRTLEFILLQVTSCKATFKLF